MLVSFLFLFSVLALVQALAVIEYLIANGSERAVDEIIEHTFQISVRILSFYLSSFTSIIINEIYFLKLLFPCCLDW